MLGAVDKLQVYCVSNATCYIGPLYEKNAFVDLFRDLVHCVHLYPMKAEDVLSSIFSNLKVENGPHLGLVYKDLY